MKKWSKLICSNITTVMIIFALIMFGARGFYSFEHFSEISDQQNDDLARQAFWNGDNVTYTEVFGEEYSPACYGMDRDDCVTEWSDNRASLFAFTVASTIGYGNHAPLTQRGRWWAIFYSFLAIPIAGACFAKICSHLMEFWANAVSSLITSRFFKDTSGMVAKFDLDGNGKLDATELGTILKSLGIPCKKDEDGHVDVEELVREWDTDGDGELSVEELKARVMSFQRLVAKAILANYELGLSFIAFIFWLFIGGWAFSDLEDLDYATAYYFCVITLTTVGFGDYVPSTNKSRAFMMFYAVGGLSAVGILLGSLGDYFDARWKSMNAMRKLKRMRNGDEAAQVSPDSANNTAPLNHDDEATQVNPEDSATESAENNQGETQPATVLVA